MHQKYAKDGLAVITVDIDPSFTRLVKGARQPGLAEIQEKVRKKVEQFNLTSLTDLILDEPPEVLESKLHFSSTPTVFVFNRQGQWRQFDDKEGTGIDHKAIEELVVKFLAAK